MDSSNSILLAAGMALFMQSRRPRLAVVVMENGPFHRSVDVPGDPDDPIRASSDQPSTADTIYPVTNAQMALIAVSTTPVYINLET